MQERRPLWRKPEPRAGESASEFALAPTLYESAFHHEWHAPAIDVEGEGFDIGMSEVLDDYRGTT
jgi:hypothetical protein